MTQYQEIEKQEREADAMSRYRYRFIKWGGFYAKFMSIMIIIDLIVAAGLVLFYIFFGVALLANHIMIS